MDSVIIKMIKQLLLLDFSFVTTVNDQHQLVDRWLGPLGKFRAYRKANDTKHGWYMPSIIRDTNIIIPNTN